LALHRTLPDRVEQRELGVGLAVVLAAHQQLHAGLLALLVEGGSSK